MADMTGIEWCDSTHNEWIGCTRVSPACDHCYAAVSAPARTRAIEWGAGKPRQRTGESNRNQPHRWNKKPFVQCPGCGWRGEWALADARCGCCPKCNHLPERFIDARRRVFCSSLSDWLDNEVPIEWLVDLLDTIRLTPNLDWLLLTKRIGNWEKRLSEAACHVANTLGYAGSLECFIGDWIHSKCPPNNVWLGITVINQAEADRDVPKLLAIPARIRFLSIEPMLGPIDLHLMDVPEVMLSRAGTGINWIICGGESGSEARPMHPDWVRSLRDQCAEARTAFMFKQWGHFRPQTEEEEAIGCRVGIVGCPDHLFLYGGYNDNGVCMRGAGKKAAGNHLDGRQHLEYPEPR